MCASTPCHPAPGVTPEKRWRIRCGCRPDDLAARTAPIARCRPQPPSMTLPATSTDGSKVMSTSYASCVERVLDFDVNARGSAQVHALRRRFSPITCTRPGVGVEVGVDVTVGVSAMGCSSAPECSSSWGVLVGVFVGHTPGHGVGTVVSVGVGAIVGVSVGVAVGGSATVATPLTTVIDGERRRVRMEQRHLLLQRWRGAERQREQAQIGEPSVSIHAGRALPVVTHVILTELGVTRGAVQPRFGLNCPHPEPFAIELSAKTDGPEEKNVVGRKVIARSLRQCRMCRWSPPKRSERMVVCGPPPAGRRGRRWRQRSRKGRARRYFVIVGVEVGVLVGQVPGHGVGVAEGVGVGVAVGVRRSAVESAASMDTPAVADRADRDARQPRDARFRCWR